MQAFRTSGSLSLAQTASRDAGSWTSPFIVIAMRCLLAPRDAPFEGRALSGKQGRS
jgi:hypothetical protein